MVFVKEAHARDYDRHRRDGVSPAEDSHSGLGDMIKTVWFGLTDDGYFVAYIPESWQDVTFRTTDYDMTTELMPEFGHLVLQANYYTHSL